MKIEDYASQHMRGIWREEYRRSLFARAWLDHYRAMRSRDLLVVRMSDDQLTELHRIANTAFSAELMAEVHEAESEIQHDVAATLAVLERKLNFGHLHLGLTGRDVSDWATAQQVKESQSLLCRKAYALCQEQRKRFKDWDTPATGMTHNQPAELTTLARKFAMPLEQLFLAAVLLHNWEPGRTRAVGGPIGTRAALQLLGWQEPMPLQSFWGAQGQIYPRDVDRRFVSALVSVGAALSNFAFLVRLLSGRGVVGEGYEEGRVGSSSMPHKRNPSRSERICGLYNVLTGYLSMLTPVAGQQWEEGDVACSVVQRVALSGAAMALDAMLENAHVVTRGLLLHPGGRGGAYGELSSLATTLLMQRGMPRKQAAKSWDNDLQHVELERVALDAARQQAAAFYQFLGEKLEFFDKAGAEPAWMEKTR